MPSNAYLAGSSPSLPPFSLWSHLRDIERRYEQAQAPRKFDLWRRVQAFSFNSMRELHNFHAAMRERVPVLRCAECVVYALGGSEAQAVILARQHFAGLDVAAVWSVLREMCEQVATYVGGGAVMGGVVGGVGGVFFGGVGAVPGAIGGATIGAEIGGWILGLLGIKSLVQYIGKAIPEMVECYSRGFARAWHAGELDQRRTMDIASDMHSATWDFAHGHLLLVTALLSAIVLYLSRGVAGRAKLYAELAHSKLGPRFAQWIEAHEAELMRHPQLQPRKTLSQLAQEAEAQKPTRRTRQEPAEEAEAPPTMPQSRVPCFTVDGLSLLSFPEFDRQLAGQEAGLNDMTVDEYLRGRKAFTSGTVQRDPKIAREARADYAQKLAKDMAKELRQQGFSIAEARAKAAEMATDKMKTLAALHNPDMVAGGKDAIADFGDKNINSRIGSLWKSRVGTLDKAARKVAQAGGADAKMNAKLERCK